MFVIVTGSPFDGMDVIGPFQDADEAAHYAENKIDVDWWVVEVKKPLGRGRG